MARFIFLLLSCFIIPSAFAINALTLNVKNLKMQGWQLQTIAIKLTGIEKNTPQFQLAIEKLLLPKPFTDLKLLQVQCTKFDWHTDEINCLHGTAQVNSQLFNSPRFIFSFHISQKQSFFKIEHFQLLQGVFNLQGTIQAARWHVELNGKQIGLKVLHQLLFPKLKLSSGTINLSGKAQGDVQGLSRVKLQTQIDNLSLQTTDGSKACEKLKLYLNLNAHKVQQNWIWQTDNVFQQGNLYIEPLYLENKGLGINLQAQGLWHPSKQQFEINYAQFHHPNVGTLSAHGLIHYQPKFTLTEADIYLAIPNLNPAYNIYLAPYINTSFLEGISFSGNLKAGMTIKQRHISKAYLTSSQLAMTDKKQRLDLQNGIVALNWADDASFDKKSMLFWRKLTLFKIPLEQSYFSFLLKQHSIRLLHKTIIPLLQGQFEIKQFSWQETEYKNPSVHFAGEIKQVSLEKLSQALNWQSLTGNISGQVPSVTFNKDKLTLDGGLKINVFNGEIAISKMALSGLLSDFSQVYGDIEINHLDLEQLTQKFSFGNIQGNISGFAKNIYLENWQPVTFFAWLGTPEDDDSAHEISQKAVENIASIGGGGMIDFLSRLILNLFDSFGYDELGFGCYLYAGVCQAMGVAAFEDGYYIVKGGGVPRIDIIGYNARIDWLVLQERLQRIMKSSSNAVIN